MNPKVLITGIRLCSKSFLGHDSRQSMLSTPQTLSPSPRLYPGWSSGPCWNGVQLDQVSEALEVWEWIHLSGLSRRPTVCGEGVWIHEGLANSVWGGCLDTWGPGQEDRWARLPGLELALWATESRHGLHPAWLAGSQLFGISGELNGGAMGQQASLPVWSFRRGSDERTGAGDGDGLVAKSCICGKCVVCDLHAIYLKGFTQFMLVNYSLVPLEENWIMLPPNAIGVYYTVSQECCRKFHWIEWPIPTVLMMTAAIGNRFCASDSHLSYHSTGSLITPRNLSCDTFVHNT